MGTKYFRRMHKVNEISGSNFRNYTDLQSKNPIWVMLLKWDLSYWTSVFMLELTGFHRASDTIKRLS